MIILEFRFTKHCLAASRLLDKHQVPHKSEISGDAWRPSLVFLYPEDVRTAPQREALARARRLEQADRHLQLRCPTPNLAVPL